MKALKRSENHSEMVTFQNIWNIRNIVVKRYSCTLLRDSMGRNSAAKLSGNSDLPALNRRVWEWHLNGLEIFEFEAYPGFIVMNTLNLAFHAPNGTGKKNIFLAFDTQHQYSIYLFDSAWFFDSACYICLQKSDRMRWLHDNQSRVKPQCGRRSVNGSLSSWSIYYDDLWCTDVLKKGLPSWNISLFVQTCWEIMLWVQWILQYIICLSCALQLGCIVVGFQWLLGSEQLQPQVTANRNP